jgi:hypothetical protein
MAQRAIASSAFGVVVEATARRHGRHAGVDLAEDLDHDLGGRTVNSTS